MTYRIQHDFLLLGKESKGFSKNYTYEWDDSLGGSSSQLFLTLQIEDFNIPSEEIGDLIFKIMKNHFFNDLESPPETRFEETLKEINHAIKEKENELETNIIPLMQVIIAVIENDHLYLSQRGDAEAYLIRRHYISTISEGLSETKETAELFSNIANGVLMTDDTLILSSKRLFRYLTKPDLAKLFNEEKSLQTRLESIRENISFESPEQINLLGIYIGQPRKETIIEGTIEENESNKTQKTDWPKIQKYTKWINPLTRKFKNALPQKFPANTTAHAEIEPREKFQDNPKHPSNNENYHSSIPAKKLIPNLDFLKNWKELKRDKILLMLIAVVIILIAGIYVVRNQGEKQQYLKELETKLAQAELNINTAQTTGSYDRDTATKLLDEAESLTKEVLNSGYLRGKANEDLIKIANQRDKLDNVSRLENPTVYLDFSTINPTMNALGMIAMGDRRYVYDSNKLYEVILNEIQNPTNIDTDETIRDAAYFEEDEALLFLTKSNRVIEYKDGQFSFMDTEDGAWHSAIDLATYNNRVYLLDPSQKQIWRYNKQRDGFSGANAYLPTDSIDLSKATSFTIDGSIFILNNDGTINKLYGGEDQNLKIQKGPTDLTGSTLIDAEFERFQVFILDPSTNKILIFNKDPRTGDLIYSKQFILENTEPLHNLYVDKESNKVYVVGQTKVYEISY